MDSGEEKQEHVGLVVLGIIREQNEFCRGKARRQGPNHRFRRLF
jgi:hypothetical protein